MKNEIIITCVGIKALNECQSAYIGNGFFGCNFKMDCIYKRPRIAIKSIKPHKKLNLIECDQHHPGSECALNLYFYCDEKPCEMTKQRRIN